MKINVHMLAFEPEYKVRQVEVNDEDYVEGQFEFLEIVFRNGQNENQPQQVASVSVGDVIEIPEKLHEYLVWDACFFLVEPYGFRPMTTQELIKYASLPRNERRDSKIFST